jgi:hypothetical protein
MTSDYRREKRIFRIWRFSASHNQLILRSEPAAVEGTNTRAEIYFGNVQLMFVRPVYKGVHIRAATTADQQKIVERFDVLQDMDGGGVYLLSPSGLDFVISSTPAWREAQRDFDEPSLFDFDAPWPPGPTVTWGEID